MTAGVGGPEARTCGSLTGHGQRLDKGAHGSEQLGTNRAILGDGVGQQGCAVM